MNNKVNCETISGKYWNWNKILPKEEPNGHSRS